jgi:hypothetical protein
VRGNLAKFSQNPALRQVLRGTNWLGEVPTEVRIALCGA